MIPTILMVFDEDKCGRFSLACTNNVIKFMPVTPYGASLRKELPVVKCDGFQGLNLIPKVWMIVSPMTTLLCLSDQQLPFLDTRVWGQVFLIILPTGRTPLIGICQCDTCKAC